MASSYGPRSPWREGVSKHSSRPLTGATWTAEPPLYVTLRVRRIPLAIGRGCASFQRGPHVHRWESPRESKPSWGQELDSSERSKDGDSTAGLAATVRLRSGLSVIAGIGKGRRPVRGWFRIRLWPLLESPSAEPLPGGLVAEDIRLPTLPKKSFSKTANKPLPLTLQRPIPVQPWGVTDASGSGRN